MSRSLRLLAAAGAGYAAGLLPSAEIVTRGIDIRSQGSGNPGAANVTNVVGPKAGAIVFGLDMGKAVAAAHIGAVIAGPVGAHVGSTASVLGHCFPATRGWRGGKGIATTFGQMLATFPAYLPVDIALGVAAAKSDYWKQRPVANIAGVCGLWVGLAGLWARRGLPNLWAPAPTLAMPAAAAVSAAAVISRFAHEASATRPE